MTPQQKKKAQKSSKDKREQLLTLSEHLAELRIRLLSLTLIFITFCIIGYIYSDKLITWLVNPLQDKLIFTSPSGGFNFRIQISLLTGFILSIPVILYHALQFIAPVFPNIFHKKIYILLSFSSILAVAGISTAYYIFLPATLVFFRTFGSPALTPLIEAQEYLRFVSWYFIGFALFFQLPVIMITINFANKLHFGSLMRMQKYVLLGSFIASAFLTPTPDVVNQTIVAIPIILLYQVSILIVVIINHFDILQIGTNSGKKR